MKIIKNPEHGGEIKKIWYKDVLYFEEPFKPGDVVKIEQDDVAVFMLNLYDFLEEITKEEAVKYLEEVKNAKFKCDECGQKFSIEIALLGHKRKHEKEARLDDELGIPVIKGKVQKIESVEEVDTQAKIDESANSEGLIGPGLVEEKNEIRARF